METYYNPEDLKKFGKIGEFQKELADKFFSYYGSVFAEGALTAREKSSLPWPSRILYNALTALTPTPATRSKKAARKPR